MTTYRIDGAYLDGRHPESVEFSSNLVEDLKRRDFTINAMAYNEQQGLVDVFEGIEDMQSYPLCRQSQRAFWRRCTAHDARNPFFGTAWF